VPQPLRLWRSVLYIPASRARAMDKARSLPCDAVIFDLEDAVAPNEKAVARDCLAAALTGGFGRRARMVRINALDTPWGAADLAAFGAHESVDAVLIPKVSGPADLDAVARTAPDKPLWAMIETATGVMNVGAIAAHPQLEGLVMGTNDLASELRARDRADRLPMMPALGLSLLAARAAGKVIVDGVYNAFHDGAGLRAECAVGRDMGFDGKTLIHPGQLAIANAAFGPSADEVDLARRHITALDAAMARGEAVAVVDGRIVENLHAAAARVLIARADAIAAEAE
jgi:(3S)-malyl-CoA thioesterase